MIPTFKRITLLILATLGALASGTSCATGARYVLATPCQGLDWFEIGRRDGSIGKPVSTFEEHVKECKGGVAPNNDLYVNGRNAGLVDFCTTQTGYEFGRAGVPYLLVCPEHLEKKFLPGYEMGRRTLQQEEQAQRNRTQRL